jgi:hypothetical protein
MTSVARSRPQRVIIRKPDETRFSAQVHIRGLDCPESAASVASCGRRARVGPESAKVGLGELPRPGEQELRAALQAESGQKVLVEFHPNCVARVDLGLGDPRAFATIHHRQGR